MNITDHIKATGVSRAELCEKVGISRAFLSLIEKGERRVGPRKVRDLAEALGIGVRDLRPDLADMFIDTPIEQSNGAAQ